MSSVYSTPADDAPPRCIPWRIILCLVLLIGAILSCRQLVPAVLDDEQADRRGDALSWAGVVAEGIEQQYVDDANADATALAASITPVFDQEPTLAYARVWSTAGQLRYTFARGQRELPEMGITPALQHAQAQVATRDAIETIAHLQELLLDQGELTDGMTRAVEAGTGAGTHGGLYVRQDDIMRLATDMTEEHPLLDDAITEMHTVLDNLTRNDAPSLAAAAKASGAAENALTLTLEDARAVIDEIPDVPETLRASLPSPTSGWRRVFPVVHLQRVLVPIFTPAVSETLVTPVGVVELGIAEYPAELAARLATRCWPSALLLLGAVLVLIPWRRRKNVN